MSTYSISIITHDRGQKLNDPGTKNPYHWSFHLEQQNSRHVIPTTALTFQLHGMPGAFYYSGSEPDDLSRPASKIINRLEIGCVPLEKMGLFRKLLEAVRIVSDESSGWNCQSWCLEAVDLMRKEGFVGEEYSNEVIINWLKEEQ